MLNVGGPEILVILVIGLIVLGPEKLPEMARKAGNVMRELRRMSQGFQTELRDALDEPVRIVREPVEQMRTTFGAAGAELRADLDPRTPVPPSAPSAESAESADARGALLPPPSGPAVPLPPPVAGTETSAS